MDDNQQPITLTELTRKQRRVLGTLLEKGFTTPDQYPLTLKACTTGCNQKNNRDPISSYDEDTVVETLEQLQRLGLVGVVHTESGRTERFRHYMRHKLTLTEVQLAVMTELLLRGRQQMGELRTRASRMRPIDTLETLREAVEGLLQLKMVQTNGPLDRRGIEIDHSLYPAGENHDAMPVFKGDSGPGEEAPLQRTVAVSSPRHTDSADTAQLTSRVQSLEGKCAELTQQLSHLASEFDQLQNSLRELQTQLGN
jgi:uncharacterized protein